MTVLVPKRPRVDRTHYRTSVESNSAGFASATIKGGGGGGGTPIGSYPSSPRFSTSGVNEVVEEIKQKLRELNRKQRKQLLDYLLYLDKEKLPELAQDREILAWGDSVVGKLRIHLPSLSPQIVINPGVLKSLQDSLVPVQTLFKSSGLCLDTIYKRKAAYDLCAGLLVSHAKQLAAHVKAPLTVRFVLQRAPDLPGLFNSAFPGYLQAGLASKVFDQMLAGIGNHSTRR